MKLKGLGKGRQVQCDLLKQIVVGPRELSPVVFMQNILSEIEYFEYLFSMYTLMFSLDPEGMHLRELFKNYIISMYKLLLYTQF